MPYKSEAQRKFFNTSTFEGVSMLQIQNLAKQAASNSEDLVNMDTWGGLAADTIAPSTWGGERAGRTQAMSRAMDEPTTFGVKHPTTQALGYGGVGGIAGALAGALLDRQWGNDGTGGWPGAHIGGGLGLLAGSGLAGLMRRKEMSRVNSLYDEDNAAGKLKPKEPKMSWLSALGLPLRGPHRTGQQEATEAMTSGEPLEGPSTIRNLLYGLNHFGGPAIGSAAALGHGYAQNAKTQLRSSERNGKKPKPKAVRKNKGRDRDKGDDKEKAAAGRCWSGYEPVPGKEAYSDGSCRPAGGKKKKQEKKAVVSPVQQLAMASADLDAFTREGSCAL